MQMGCEVFHHLGKLLKANGDSTNVGNEGGYAPAKIQGTEGALDLISEAVKAAGYELGKDITFAMDAASSEFAKEEDRKSTRLNSSHANISYAVFCLKKKKQSIRY